MALVLGTVGLALLASPGGGAAPHPENLYLEPIPGSPYSAPTFLTAPPGDASRLFIVQQGGIIRIVRDGSLLATPFLDITSLVLSGGERGLLSMAFAPDYATSRKFYVYYTARTPEGQITVAEFLRDASNPDVADPATRRTVITVDHMTYSNHNGGQLEFGPDGYLYLGTGDGGSGGDPDHRGQDLTEGLGKIMRIDPLRGDPYEVPPNNPFVNQPPALPEIFAYGVRNPWRYSFDRQTGDLVVADVGQNAWEEIDYTPLALGGGNGANFGWSCYEGRHAYNLNQPLCMPPPPTVMPVFEYPHSGGHGGCSITGGYVVRDADLPTLLGRYIYGDYCTGTIYSNILQIPDAQDDQPTGLSVGALSSFGEDACGHVYALSLNGPVYRIYDTPPPPPPSCGRAFPNTLTGDVGPDYTIHLRDPDGNDLDGGTLPAGTYTVEIDDLSEIHNFHLFGDAVECVPPSTCQTDVAGTGHEVWTVNLTPGTAEYQCDPHSATRRTRRAGSRSSRARSTSGTTATTAPRR